MKKSGSASDNSKICSKAYYPSISLFCIINHALSNIRGSNCWNRFVSSLFKTVRRAHVASTPDNFTKISAEFNEVMKI